MGEHKAVDERSGSAFSGCAWADARRLALAAVLIAATGCAPTGFFGLLGGESEAPIVVTALALEGTTEAPSDVMVAGVNATDGTAGTSWRALFKLDSGQDQNSLALDSGADSVYALRVEATNSATGESIYRRVTITAFGQPKPGQN